MQLIAGSEIRKDILIQRISPAFFHMVSIHKPGDAGRGNIIHKITIITFVKIKNPDIISVHKIIIGMKISVYHPKTSAGPQEPPSLFHKFRRSAPSDQPEDFPLHMQKTAPAFHTIFSFITLIPAFARCRRRSMDTSQQISHGNEMHGIQICNLPYRSPCCPEHGRPIMNTIDPSNSSTI